MKTIEQIVDRTKYEAIFSPENAREVIEDLASRDVQKLGNGITTSNYYIYNSGKVTNRNNVLVQGKKLTLVILASDLDTLEADGTIGYFTGDNVNNSIEFDTENVLQMLTKSIKIYDYGFKFIQPTGAVGGNDAITTYNLPINYLIDTTTLAIRFTSFPTEGEWGGGSKLVFDVYFYEDN